MQNTVNTIFLEIYDECNVLDTASNTGTYIIDNITPALYHSTVEEAAVYAGGDDIIGGIVYVAYSTGVIPWNYCCSLICHCECFFCF